MLREPHLYLDLDVDRWPTDLTDRVGRPEREVSLRKHFGPAATDFVGLLHKVQFFGNHLHLVSSRAVMARKSSSPSTTGHGSSRVASVAVVALTLGHSRLPWRKLLRLVSNLRRNDGPRRKRKQVWVYILTVALQLYPKLCHR